MRVLHVVLSLHPDAGGPAKSVPALCHGLACSGVEVSLYATSAGPRPWDGLPASGEVERDGYLLHLFPTRWRGPVSLSRALVKAVRRHAHEYDLVHVHGVWNPTVTFSMRAARRRRTPYGLTPRGMLDPVVFSRHKVRKSLWGALWARRNVEKALFIHFTTIAEEGKARTSGWRLPRSSVIPNAIDLSEWDALPSGPEFERCLPALQGRQVVLFSGRINWVKNLPVLVRAFAELGRKDSCLVLAGPDSEGHGAELARLAGELGVADRVLFAGMLDRCRLKAAYAAADVLVLPSKKENFGMAAAEAMAFGVPVVLSSGVDMAREVANSKAGVIADSATEIAEALRRMLADEDSRKQMGCTARKWARAMFDFRSIGRRMREAYACALSRIGGSYPGP